METTLMSNNVSQPAYLPACFLSCLSPSLPFFLLPDLAFLYTTFMLERERSRERREELKRRRIYTCIYNTYLLNPLSLLNVWHRNILQVRHCESTRFSSLQSLCTISHEKVLFGENAINQIKRWEIIWNVQNAFYTLHI